MKTRVSGLFVAALSSTLGLVSGTALAERDGRDDGQDDKPVFLNVVTRQAQAEFLISKSCQRGRVHEWGRRDATGRIRQWLNHAAATASNRACIRLDDRVAEVRITPLGGHCGYEYGTASEPDVGAVLRRAQRVPVTVSGCHAAISDTQFGGVALRFADGYGLGDSYVTGVFYGAYDAFGSGRVAPLGEPVFKIAERNTHHFRVDVLDRRGRPWRPESDSDRGGR